VHLWATTINLAFTVDKVSPQLKSYLAAVPLLGHAFSSVLKLFIAI